MLFKNYRLVTHNDRSAQDVLIRREGYKGGGEENESSPGRCSEQGRNYRDQEDTDDSSCNDYEWDDDTQNADGLMTLGTPWSDDEGDATTGLQETSHAMLTLRTEKDARVRQYLGGWVGETTGCIFTTRVTAFALSLTALVVFMLAVRSSIVNSSLWSSSSSWDGIQVHLWRHDDGIMSLLDNCRGEICHIDVRPEGGVQDGDHSPALHGDRETLTSSMGCTSGQAAFADTAVPAIGAPFGMAHWVPETQRTANRCIPPYYDSRGCWGQPEKGMGASGNHIDKKRLEGCNSDPVLTGFRLSHWITAGSEGSPMCTQDYSSVTLMPLILPGSIDATAFQRAIEEWVAGQCGERQKGKCATVEGTTCSNRTNEWCLSCGEWSVTSSDGKRRGGCEDNAALWRPFLYQAQLHDGAGQALDVALSASSRTASMEVRVGRRQRDYNENATIKVGDKISEAKHRRKMAIVVLLNTRGKPTGKQSVALSSRDPTGARMILSLPAHKMFGGGGDRATGVAAHYMLAFPGQFFKDWGYVHARGRSTASGWRGVGVSPSLHSRIGLWGIFNADEAVLDEEGFSLVAGLSLTSVEAAAKHISADFPALGRETASASARGSVAHEVYRKARNVTHMSGFSRTNKPLTASASPEPSPSADSSSFETTFRRVVSDTAARSLAQWSRHFDRIRVECSQVNSAICRDFYHALYRCLLQPRLYSDLSGSHPIFGSRQERYASTTHAGLKVDTSSAKPMWDYYSDFIPHVTHAELHPLLALIAPDEAADMVRSLLRMAEGRNGALPGVPLWNIDAAEETTVHGVDDKGPISSTATLAIVADAFGRGVISGESDEVAILSRAAHVAEATVNSKSLRPDLQAYVDLGYVPVDEGGGAPNHIDAKREPRRMPNRWNDDARQESIPTMSMSSISRTINYAYADRMAAVLIRASATQGGDATAAVVAATSPNTEQYAVVQRLTARALSYRNHYDTGTNTWSVRLANGTFFSEGGHRIGDTRHATDTTSSSSRRGGNDAAMEERRIQELAWISTIATYDLDGLLDLVGGISALEQTLDRLFLGDTPDVGWGLMSRIRKQVNVVPKWLHAPAARRGALNYILCGRPWKTQALFGRAQRQIVGHAGSGDAAWIVWRTIGLIPMPATVQHAYYILTTPMAHTATLTIDGVTKTLSPSNISHESEMRETENWNIADTASKWHSTGEPSIGGGEADHRKNINSLLTVKAVGRNGKQPPTLDDIFIVSASLDGRQLNRAWLLHEELSFARELRLVLGRTPNKAWGTDVQSLPTSANLEAARLMLGTATHLDGSATLSNFAEKGSEE